MAAVMIVSTRRPGAGFVVSLVAGIGSVWVSGFDRTFIALRTDVEQDAKRHVNPYASSYFSYFSLVLQQSVPRRLPPWFARGLAGVMSNTVIDDKNVLLGPPAPW